MRCKIYCYQHKKICDLVFEIKNFGVVSMEHYPVDDYYWKTHWESLKDYESTHSVKFKKTYIGEV